MKKITVIKMLRELQRWDTVEGLNSWACCDDPSCCDQYEVYERKDPEGYMVLWEDIEKLIERIENL
jgi:hypothetical protein